MTLKAPTESRLRPRNCFQKAAQKKECTFRRIFCASFEGMTPKKRPLELVTLHKSYMHTCTLYVLCISQSSCQKRTQAVPGKSVLQNELLSGFGEILKTKRNTFYSSFTNLGMLFHTLCRAQFSLFTYFLISLSFCIFKSFVQSICGHYIVLFIESSQIKR